MIDLLLTSSKIFEWLATKIGKRADLWKFLEDECMAQTICDIKELCSGTSNKLLKRLTSTNKQFFTSQVETDYESKDTSTLFLMAVAGIDACDPVFAKIKSK
jgi:hypothetical protein